MNQKNLAVTGPQINSKEATNIELPWNNFSTKKMEGDKLKDRSFYFSISIFVFGTAWNMIDITMRI